MGRSDCAAGRNYPWQAECSGGQRGAPFSSIITRCASMTETTAPFYHTGGTLRPDAPSYVERHADQELSEGLLRGEFCYVLTSRQRGKSSLMNRLIIGSAFQYEAEAAP